MKIVLELFVCARKGHKSVCYHRRCRDISDSHDDPDKMVEEMLKEMGMDCRSNGACAHSTSWRYERAKRARAQTLLTYVVWVAARAMLGIPNRLLAVESVLSPPGASAPLAPRPRRISEEQVLIHALHHLHYLVCERDEPMLSMAMAATGSMPFIKSLSPALAGRLA